jgi:predicted DCC family thiol-disulfide oxidoreductase YuxK
MGSAGRPSIHGTAHGHGVVLFDGTCAFCEGAVVFIAKRDPAGFFRFGASQTAEGRVLIEQFGLSDEASRSLILIEDGEVYLRSTAALRIAARLTWPWSWARVLLAVPRFVRDAVYRFVSTVRYRIAGRSNACEIPPPEIRGRLI